MKWAMAVSVKASRTNLMVFVMESQVHWLLFIHPLLMYAEFKSIH